MAMVEPFISHRVDGRVRNELTADAMVRAVTVSAGLGTTSAYTWLKVPVVEDMDRVMAASTLPALILGGEVAADQDSAFVSGARRSPCPPSRAWSSDARLLYPPDGDVAGAVGRRAVGLPVTLDDDPETRPRWPRRRHRRRGRSSWS